ncbi:MAG: hypothetical protein EOM12_13655 [Verrucomicrobiae bacterium]|nr:hypothetical protein [Verrucomicrobiae bacterium]
MKHTTAIIFRMAMLLCIMILPRPCVAADYRISLSLEGTLAWLPADIPIYSYEVFRAEDMTSGWNSVLTTETYNAHVELTNTVHFFRVGRTRIPSYFVSNITVEDDADAAIRLYENSAGEILDQIAAPGYSIIDARTLTTGVTYVYYRGDDLATQWVAVTVTNGVPSPDNTDVKLHRKRYVTISYAFNTNNIPNVEPGDAGVTTGRYAATHWGRLPHFTADWQAWQMGDNESALFGDTPYLRWHRYSSENGFIVSDMAYEEVSLVPTNGYSSFHFKATPGSVLYCRIVGHTDSTRGYGKLLIENVTETPPPGVPVLDGN